VIGGLVLTAVPELLRPVGDARLVLFGLVILLGPLLFPEGLVSPALLERLGRLGSSGRSAPSAVGEPQP
jgi:branched-chain amino acid transport system permease protein